MGEVVTRLGDEADGIAHNGEFTESGAKQCLDFNAGRPCKRLLPDGTCMFNRTYSQ